MGKRKTWSYALGCSMGIQWVEPWTSDRQPGPSMSCIMGVKASFRDFYGKLLLEVSLWFGTGLQVEDSHISHFTLMGHPAGHTITCAHTYATDKTTAHLADCGTRTSVGTTHGTSHETYTLHGAPYAGRLTGAYTFRWDMAGELSACLTYHGTYHGSYQSIVHPIAHHGHVPIH